MSADYIIKRGDLLPALTATLKDHTGTPANLTGYTAMQLRYRLPGGAVTTKTATISDAPNGVVSYAWGAGDTDVAGTYEAEWRGTGPAGKQQTWPTNGYFAFQITEVIA